MKTTMQLLPLIVVTTVALAQPTCAPTVTVDGAAGLDRAIAGMIRWDLDGSGPQPPGLVFTGDFITADGLATPGNVFWTGSSWQPLNNSATSRIGASLFVHQGQPQTLRDRLNGSTWEPLPDLPFPLNSGTLSLPVSFGESVALVRVTPGPNVRGYPETAHASACRARILSAA